MYTQPVYCSHKTHRNKNANKVIKYALYPNHFIAHLANTQNICFCADHVFSSLGLLQFYSRMMQTKIVCTLPAFMCFYLDKTSMYFQIFYRTGDNIKLSHGLIWYRFLDPLLQRKGKNNFVLNLILDRGYFCPPDHVKHSYILKLSVIHFSSPVSKCNNVISPR